MDFHGGIMRTETNVINLEKYKLKKYLETNGFQWLEDRNGKVKIWIRKSTKTENPKINRPL